MFQEEYRRAYCNITPAGDSIDKICSRAEQLVYVRKQEESEKRIGRQQRVFKVVRPVIVTLLIIILGYQTVLPVMAKHIPPVYSIIEKYVPKLAESILPEETSSTSKGITMQVEAIEIVDNMAEILISFRDVEGSEQDLISGKIDLYDSYYLRNLGESWAAGGAHFLEYDATEDKAYFKLDLTSSEDYEKRRVSFHVGQILTRVVKEERQIDIINLLANPSEKVVSLNGIGGSMENRAAFPFFQWGSTDDSPLHECRVMDIVTLNESMIEDLQITGVAYDEGVLRVQSCRGSFADADRHIRLYLKDAQGNEISNDCSVGWQEEINGVRVSFEEHWFKISEEELENYELYAMFYITDGSVKGNWDVTFTVE